MPEQKIQFVDLTGEWEFVGQPIYPDGKTGRGIIAITFKQNGTEIMGELASVIEPYTNKPPDDPELTNAKVAGQVILTALPNANLVRFT